MCYVIQNKIYKISSQFMSKGAKAVALFMVSKGNKDGTRIFPSTSTIADSISYDSRSVIRIRNHLVYELGLFEVVYEASAQRPTEYSLNVAVLDALVEASIGVNLEREKQRRLKKALRDRRYKDKILSECLVDNPEDPPVDNHLTPDKMCVDPLTKCASTPDILTDNHVFTYKNLPCIRDEFSDSVDNDTNFEEVEKKMETQKAAVSFLVECKKSGIFVGFALERYRGIVPHQYFESNPEISWDENETPVISPKRRAA